ncbi:MAG: Na+/H+ antiporter NhaA [Proteobacteria bacterium]|nr:Na+/H+ antiporter NhaA [Pseudomonadota bacterium]
MFMLREFFKLEATAGVLLVVCALAAMLVANSPWHDAYHHILHETFGTVEFGGIGIANKSIQHWINDGLMSIFFLLVGLELKREMREGVLSSWRQMALPLFAAIGGIIVPGIIFTLFNHNNPKMLAGWAIPTATDIAFAVGIFALVGKRLPIELKVFLLAIAIIDDIGAILIIALFYSGDLSWVNLAWAGVFTAGLALLNYMNVNRLSLYGALGLGLWLCVFKSGIHATLAGVIIAFFIPLEGKTERRSLLRQLEHDLHPLVAYVVLPLFAFANAGVYLGDASIDILWDHVTLGIVCGLVFGKQTGIFLMTFLTIKSGLASLPRNTNWAHIWGVSILAGVGFTMSLFIGNLAYQTPETRIFLTETKLGIICGSSISAIIGLMVLYTISRVRPSADTDIESLEVGNKKIKQA